MVRTQGGNANPSAGGQAALMYANDMSADKCSKVLESEPCGLCDLSGFALRNGRLARVR